MNDPKPYKLLHAVDNERDEYFGTIYRFSFLSREEALVAGIRGLKAGPPGRWFQIILGDKIIDYYECNAVRHNIERFNLENGLWINEIDKLAKSKSG